MANLIPFPDAVLEDVKEAAFSRKDRIIQIRGQVEAKRMDTERAEKELQKHEDELREVAGFLQQSPLGDGTNWFAELGLKAAPAPPPPEAPAPVPPYYIREYNGMPSLFCERGVVASFNAGSQSVRETDAKHILRLINLGLEALA